MKKPFLPVLLLVLLFVFGLTFLSRSAPITQLGGIAVAQGTNHWNNLKDAAVGDGQTSGIGLFTPCLWQLDLTGCNRQRGTNDGIVIVEQQTVGTAFFSVKRADVTTASSNQAFGFTSRKVSLEFPSTNTDEVCIDWLGGTAVCPAANTAGDDRFAPGDTIFIDDYQGTSISVIAASGTQTVYVRAWR